MYEATNQQKSSMAEIFIHFMSFILLGITAVATGILYFQVINKYFPDILSATYRNYQLSSFSISAIQYSMASLIIGFPIYLWALWFWFRSFRNISEKIESKLSKWLTYIILLIAGGTIIGDLITVVFNFLQGEYSSRFFLKALVILVIAGLVFSFYFFERKKVQHKKEISPSLFSFIGFFSALLIILAIILGFVVGGSPKEARLRKFDSQRANDLQTISSAVNSFAYDNGRLPVNLDEIKNNTRYSYGYSYADPETQKSYEYIIISQNAGANGSAQYELCATFVLSTLGETNGLNSYDYGYGNWVEHDSGRVCKTQTTTFVKQPMPEIPVK